MEAIACSKVIIAVRCMLHLRLAQPAHKLLLHGCVSRTGWSYGSAHSAEPRLGMTASRLRDAGARAGTIFGRLSDAEAYTMILERNMALLVIRQREHMLPLRAALRAAVEKRSCAF